MIVVMSCWQPIDIRILIFTTFDYSCFDISLVLKKTAFIPTPVSSNQYPLLKHVTTQPPTRARHQTTWPQPRQSANRSSSNELSKLMPASHCRYLKVKWNSGNPGWRQPWLRQPGGGRIDCGVKIDCGGRIDCQNGSLLSTTWPGISATAEDVIVIGPRGHIVSQFKVLVRELGYRRQSYLIIVGLFDPHIFLSADRHSGLILQFYPVYWEKFASDRLSGLLKGILFRFELKGLSFELIPLKTSKKSCMPIWRLEMWF